jgi:ubiquinone/menaquinone biosynthesis C-methylase UbiE
LPTIEENKMTWNNPQTWKKCEEGEGWSKRWGSSGGQWMWTIFPRIQRYVPTERILEIAPGFGRWTNYLKELCKELIVVDLSELCIQRCKKRFSSSSNIIYHLNDGKTLDMIDDNSIDFVFSFDSLVHAEYDVIEAYVTQLARKLKPNGVGWLHHSNLETYSFFQRTKLFNRFSAPAFRAILGFRSHKRSWKMKAKKFEQIAEKAGMQTISQEKINWGTSHIFLIDCISVFTPKGSIWARPNRVLSNGHFMEEPSFARRINTLYG